MRLAAGVLCGFLAIFAQAAPGRVPDIALPDLSGALHSLDEYIGQGRWVVLNIWGPGCPPCREEMPELVSFHEDHRDRDAIVLGVAVDFPSLGPAKRDQVAIFVDDHFISFPVLLGEGKIVPAFGGGPLQGVPTSLIFEPGGTLVARQVGTVTQELIESFMRRYTERQRQSPAGPSSGTPTGRFVPGDRP